MQWKAIWIWGMLALSALGARERIPLRLAFDGDPPSGQALPEFRKADQQMLRSTGKTVNLGGLDTLRLSGSGQFGVQGFDRLLQQIDRPIKDIVILDLRSEPHAFLNEIPICWRPLELRLKLKGIPADQLVQMESSFLQRILDQKEVEVWREGDTNWLGRAKVVPQRGETEERLTIQKKVRYSRLPLTSKDLPTSEQVDDLVRLVRTMDGSDWLHVHCREGKARTTLVMAMVDMMFNARNVPFLDILTRQYTLGGDDFLQIPTDPEWNPQPWDRYYPPSEIVPPYRNDGEMWGNNMLGNSPLFQNDPVNPFFLPYDPMVFEFEIPQEQWGDPAYTRARLDFLQNFYGYCREQQRTGYRLLFSEWLNSGIQVELSSHRVVDPHRRLLQATWRTLFRKQHPTAEAFVHGLRQP
jgi:hypothetical protein